MSKKLRVGDAFSSDNEIVFHSVRSKGYSAKAILSEDGTIVTSYEKANNNTKKNLSYSLLDRFLMSLLKISALCSFLYSILYMLCTEGSFSYLISYVYISISFLYTIIYIVGALFYWKSPEGESISKLHSAEHMAIHAIKKLQRVPTLEEIKYFSRIISSCGTNIPIFFALILLQASITALLLQGITSIIAYILSIVLLYLLLKAGLLNFMQYITTAPPTDTELKVAIAGIQVWFIHETILEK